MAYRAADDQHINAVGFLVDEPGDSTYVIQTLDGRREKWSNAHFHAFPSEKQIGSGDDVSVELPMWQKLARTLRVFGFNTYEASISPCGKA